MYSVDLKVCTSDSSCISDVIIHCMSYNNTEMEIMVKINVGLSKKSTKKEVKLKCKLFSFFYFPKDHW